MRSAWLVPFLLTPLLGGCAVVGPEGFFVQLYGRVYDEHQQWVGGAHVSLATGEGALVAECVTDESGWYSAAVLVGERRGHSLRVVVTAEGYASSEAWVDLDLTEGEPATLPAYPPQTWSLWARELPALSLALEVNSGQAEGVVVDALTGEAPMEEQSGHEVPVVFQVELRKGWNAPDSERVTVTVTTGTGVDGGHFSIEGVPTGLYTARIPGTSGYTSARFPVLVRSSTARQLRVAVTPALASDELRATLVWGDTPADLDLHITGPRASVAPGDSQWERFHVWTGEPYHPANASDVHDRVVAMERTDEDGGGPEGLAVYDLRAVGDYRFTVYDVAHSEEEASEDLSWSGALVQLWLGTRTPEFFEIAPGQQGNSWLAAEWDSEDDVLVRLQELENIVDEYDDEAF